MRFDFLRCPSSVKRDKISVDNLRFAIRINLLVVFKTIPALSEQRERYVVQEDERLLL
jgi:hypothetical protein